MGAGLLGERAGGFYSPISGQVQVKNPSLRFFFCKIRNKSLDVVVTTFFNDVQDLNFTGNKKGSKGGSNDEQNI